MSQSSGVVSLYEALNAAWKRQDVVASTKLLEQAKVALTAIPFLPSSQAEAQKKELLVARNILEIGAQLSLTSEDVDSFKRYLAQLKVYYHDYAQVLPESDYEYELLGLNLLCLLSENKIADFHTELEQLPEDSLENNPYISNPVRLEQFIMEGSYNKVIIMKDNVPARSYAFFINKLLDTIREEIASCMERAYTKVSLQECSRMLQLDIKSTEKMIKARDWKLHGQIVEFSDGSEVKSAEEIATEELAKMAITYAREMEQIV